MKLQEADKRRASISGGMSNVFKRFEELQRMFRKVKGTWAIFETAAMELTAAGNESWEPARRNASGDAAIKSTSGRTVLQ